MVSYYSSQRKIIKDQSNRHKRRKTCKDRQGGEQADIELSGQSEMQVGRRKETDK